MPTATNRNAVNTCGSGRGKVEEWLCGLWRGRSGEAEQGERGQDRMREEQGGRGQDRVPEERKAKDMGGGKDVEEGGRGRREDG